MIRKATLADVPQITDIYNDAVLNTFATFDTEEKTVEDRERWFLSHTGEHFVTVSEDSGEINGWASLSRFREKAAYDITAEVSVYVRASQRGRGIGGKLLSDLVKKPKRAKQ